MQMISKPKLYAWQALAALLARPPFGPPLAQPAHYHAFAEARPSAGYRMPWTFVEPAVRHRGPGGAVLPVGRAAARRRATCSGRWRCCSSRACWSRRPAPAGITCSPTCRPRRGPRRHGGGVRRPAGSGGYAGGEQRAGAALASAVLVLAPLSAIGSGRRRGNVLPWAVVQFGGMALLVWFRLAAARGTGAGRPLGLVIAAYAVAKLLELGDHAVYACDRRAGVGPHAQARGGRIRGWPVVAAAVRPARQGRMPCSRPYRGPSRREQATRIQGRTTRM